MITLGERAEQALRVVREAPIIAYDTETSGLDWKVNHPIGYVITTEDCNNYIPVRHGGGGNLLDPRCAPLTSVDAKSETHSFEVELSKAFDDRRQKGFLTVCHNAGFDMHMSANRGIYLGRNCGDTQINAAMLDEFNFGGFSLDAVAKSEKVTAKKGDALYQHMASLLGDAPDKKIMGRFWEMDGSDPVVNEYATGDGQTTLEVWHSQMKGIAEEEMSFIHEIESKLIWTVFRIERLGMRVDPERMDWVIQELARRLDLANLKLPRGFNVRSPVAVRKLCEDAGHTDWPMTAPSSKFSDGQPSFPEKFLKGFPEGKAVVDVRKLTNISNSFIVPLKDRHVHLGRVHSQLNQLKSDEYGTISGRFSSSSPNMQQVPKRDKDLGRLFRSIFVPDEGMDFYEADYSQCEPRLFAHYSKEPSLLDGYNQTPFRDMHAVVAEMLVVERDPTAKRMNMGILTGMQAKSFAGHMDWPMDRATAAFNAWFEGFPGIRKFQEDAKNVFRSRGYVKTILGRRCRLDNPRFSYRGTSRIIQGGNADIIKERMLRCDEYLESEDDYVQLLMTVHDSFNWQAPKGERGEAISNELVRICEDVQSPPFNLRVPFVMEVGKGPNWGIATYGPEAMKEAA